MLSSEEVRLLLGLLSQHTVVEPSREFPFRISQPVRGYSEDPKIGGLQAKLSVMLEAASRAEAR